MHRLVGEAGGRVARLRQRFKRWRVRAVGFRAQGVARLLAQLAIDAALAAARAGQVDVALTARRETRCTSC